jgi:hypothetical protein
MFETRNGADRRDRDGQLNLLSCSGAHQHGGVAIAVATGTRPTTGGITQIACGTPCVIAASPDTTYI